MRALIVPASYPPVLGGVQTVAHALAQHLLARGHGVSVVTNRYPRSLDGQECIDSVSVRRLPFLWPQKSYLDRGRPDLFLASLWYGPRTLAMIHNLMGRERPDVINVHFPDQQIVFVQWLRQQYPFRLVVSLHGDEVLRWFREQNESALIGVAALDRLQWVLREADVVTSCSQYLLDAASRLESSILAKGVVIHNGIDPGRFQSSAAYVHPRPYIFGVGRFVLNKGFDLLIEAWAKSNTGDQHDLILAGDGPEINSLRTLVARCGINESIHFWGRATPAEVTRLLNGCELVVVPSRSEPFGIVALEALAAGKPLVATEVGGLPEIVASLPSHRMREGSVRLVSPTVEGLESGLNEMLEEGRRLDRDPPLASFIQESFSWERVGAAYEEVLLG